MISVLGASTSLASSLLDTCPPFSLFRIFAFSRSPVFFIPLLAFALRFLLCFFFSFFFFIRFRSWFSFFFMFSCFLLHALFILQRICIFSFIFSDPTMLFYLTVLFIFTWINVSFIMLISFPLASTHSSISILFSHFSSEFSIFPPSLASSVHSYFAISFSQSIFLHILIGPVF